MNTKSEALEIILRAVPEVGLPEEVPLDTAQDRVLARDVASDMDMPPFDRSAMDGWAVRSGDVDATGARLEIAGRVMAGEVPERPLVAGQAMKVMTGAPLPDGADAVVIVENSIEAPDGIHVTFTAAARPRQHVVPRASDVRAGERVLGAGTRLDAVSLGLLAMVGVDPVPVTPLPSVCVVPTGDELVDPSGAAPGPGMIRESNGILLAAQVRQVCMALRPLRPGTARDDVASISRFLDVGLDHDVLILSGGVSMGDRDLIGSQLIAAGLEVLVDKVSIKPGKPLLVGRVARGDGHMCHVFALPGNPVASFVTFELFVRPFLLGFMGRPDVAPDELDAVLGGERKLVGIPRLQHLPAVVEPWSGGLAAVPVTWHGSGDLRGLVDANSLILVGPDADPVKPGKRVRVQLLPGRPLRAPTVLSREGDAS